MSFKNKDMYIKVLKEVIYCFITFITTLLLFTCVYYYFSGVIPNFSSIIYGQARFYSLGYFMIKMPLLSPWIFIIILYFVTLCKSIRGFYDFNNKSSIIKNSMYFIISIIGLGIFSYYQGRSCDGNLFSISYPCFILLGMLCDDYLISKKQFHMRIKALLIVIFLSIIGSITLIGLVFKNTLYNEKKVSHEINNIEVIDTINLYKELKPYFKKIDIITNYAYGEYVYLKDKSIPKFSSTIDWLSREDFNDILVYLENNNNILIFDSVSYNLLEQNENKRFKRILKKYNEKKDYGTIFYFEPNDL